MTYPLTISPSDLPSLVLDDRRDLPDTAAIDCRDAESWRKAGVTLRLRWP